MYAGEISDFSRKWCSKETPRQLKWDPGETTQRCTKKLCWHAHDAHRQTEHYHYKMSAAATAVQLLYRYGRETSNPPQPSCLRVLFVAVQTAVLLLLLYRSRLRLDAIRASCKHRDDSRERK